ncbi:CHAT domain-containing protein [Scytonema sp. NUACC26]|uniref:CHAT domain-containing protein n=1 Tax=Scytonema sp. NUACC26 TaxID=3140176 RepID=UPI0034DC6EDA
MEPEVFLEQKEIIPLTKVLIKVLTSEANASDRRSLLKNAEISSAFIGNLRLESQPNTLAQSLVAAFKSHHMSSKQPDYHPMVKFLSYLTELGLTENYEMSDEELDLFNRLIERGQKNIKAFKVRNGIDVYASRHLTSIPTDKKTVGNNLNSTKILFIAAAPSDTSSLQLGKELRDIRERLRLCNLRDTFTIQSITSARPGDISQALLDFKPHIVHFSGHGTHTGELCFENNLGETNPVAPTALAAMFKLVSHHVNCVVLNACYSEIQARGIIQHISFVVAMNKAIGDKAAITFAVGFYKALGAGETIERAFEFGLVELQLENIPEELTPVLYKQNLT